MVEEIKPTPGYSNYSEGVKACLPTVMGYIGIGIAAGIVGNSSGLSILQIASLSVFVYAGSAQFIICSMIALNGEISAIIVTTFLVNLRLFLMSLSVASYFKEHSMLKSIGIGTLLTDESYGVLMTTIYQKNNVSLDWINGLNLTAYFSWILATILGGLIGEWLPNPDKFGLDFALTGMFIGLIILQVDYPIRKKTKQTIIVLLSVCVSLFMLMSVFSSEISVILSTLLGCGVGVLTTDD